MVTPVYAGRRLGNGTSGIDQPRVDRLFLLTIRFAAVPTTKTLDQLNACGVLPGRLGGAQGENRPVPQVAQHGPE